MRSRSDLDKMRKHADRWRRSLGPRSAPIIWVIPHWVAYGSPEMDALIQAQVRHMCEYWLAPGFDLGVELVRNYDAISARDQEDHVRFTAVRRDTNSLRDARWLSETPRGPRDE